MLSLKMNMVSINSRNSVHISLMQRVNEKGYKFGASHGKEDDEVTVHRGTRQEPNRHNWTTGCGQLSPFSTLQWSWEGVPYQNTTFCVTGRRWQFGSQLFEPYRHEAPEVNMVACLFLGSLQNETHSFFQKRKKCFQLTP